MEAADVPQLLMDGEQPSTSGEPLPVEEKICSQYYIANEAAYSLQRFKEEKRCTLCTGSTFVHNLCCH